MSPGYREMAPHAPKIDVHCHVWNLGNEADEATSAERLISTGDHAGHHRILVFVAHYGRAACRNRGSTRGERCRAEGHETLSRPYPGPVFRHSGTLSARIGRD